MVFSYFHTRVTTEREFHKYKKLLLTLDSSNHNPYCQSYDNNKQSMIDFEGNMYGPSWRSKHQVMFEEEDYDVTNLNYTMASLTESDREVQH